MVWLTGCPGCGKTTAAKHLGLSTFSTDRFARRKWIPKGWIGKQLRQFNDEQQAGYVADFVTAYGGGSIIEGFVPSHMMNLWVAARN